MMKKRNLLLFAAALIAVPLMFASCGGGGEEEPTPPGVKVDPGKIPGLGNTEGDLTGAPFTLPGGVTLVEGITGAAYNLPSYWADDNYFARVAKPGGETPYRRTAATRADQTWHWFGSGPGYVDLVIRLHNDNNAPSTVVFPAALIVRSLAGDCQNGVLLKKVTVTIPPKSNYNIVVSFYCGNADKGTAGPRDDYEWGVVSNASPVLELCELVKNKKINLEEFDPGDDEGHMIYNTQTSILQGAVWSITDDDGLSEYRRTQIAELPNS